MADLIRHLYSEIPERVRNDEGASLTFLFVTILLPEAAGFEFAGREVELELAAFI